MARERRRRQRRRGSARAKAERHARRYEPTVYKLPEGTEDFSLPKKQCMIHVDVLPYIAGKGNPNCSEGFEWYERTFYWHRQAGRKSIPYVCPRETFGHECPVCEHWEYLDEHSDLPKAQINQFKPKERQLFNVLSLDGDGPDKGVQILQLSYMLFGEALDERLLFKEELEDFWTWDEGMTCELTIREDSFGEKGQKFWKVSRVDFLEREAQYDKSVLEQTHCLDELLIETPYEKLKRIFLEGTAEEDEPADEPGQGLSVTKGMKLWFVDPESGKRTQGKVLAMKAGKLRVVTRQGIKKVIRLKDVVPDDEVPF